MVKNDVVWKRTEFWSNLWAVAAILGTNRSVFSSKPTNITNKARKIIILFTLIGSSFYSMLRSLTASATTWILRLWGDDFEPAPSEIFQRFHFNSVIWQSKESVAEYVTDLHKVMKYCNFEMTVDTMLRNRLVCGVRNDGTQENFWWNRSSHYKMILKFLNLWK